MEVEKVFVTGVSGTGKTTVCRELAKRGVSTIGIDETKGLSYWVHKETGERLIQKANFTKEFLDTYEWACDIKLLKDLLEKAEKPIVVCGSVENVVECIRECDKSLLLMCEPKTFIGRINARTDNEYGQGIDAQEALLGYYKEYNRECLDADAEMIDAEKPIDEVVNEVLSHIR